MGSTLATQLAKLSNGFCRGHRRIETRPSEEAGRIAELEAAVRARDEFIAIAAHELRNPMTPILGYVEHILAVSRLSEIDCPQAIVASLERLAGLIDQYIERATTLLNVSRITAGKLRVELSVVDFSATIRHAVDQYRTPAERSGCCLKANIEDDVSGMLDQLMVEQIADNLIWNAVKYGTGKPVKISLVRQGAEARLTVRDYGIGISQADQARIFAVFERAVTWREQGGFGIGLWVVRQLVDAMHCKLHVTSRPARGSTFTVIFPLPPAEATQ
jgi:signal transduction histidine kinase